jgi:hypothetical protein
MNLKGTSKEFNKTDTDPSPAQSLFVDEGYSNTMMQLSLDYYF